MRHLIFVTIALVLSLAALSARADTPDYVTSSMQSPLRAADARNDARRQMAAIMTFTQVKPGQKVVELIPAEGYWTKVFSGIVGAQGHDYTLWPDGYQQYVQDAYAGWQKLVTTDYKNVSLIRDADDHFKLPEPVDLVFINQNYHDYHDKFMGPVDMAAFDKKIFDALKPGGYFVVIDNVAPAGSGFSDTDTTHRIDPEAVKKEVESAGFVFDASSNVLRNPGDTHKLVSYTPPMAGHNDQFIFRFKKPAKP